MTRHFTIAAALLALALSAAPAAADEPDAKGCDLLPHVRIGLKTFKGPAADRDRAKWQIDTAEKLCAEGKAAEAKPYLDLAHKLVLKDHKH